MLKFSQNAELLIVDLALELHVLSDLNNARRRLVIILNNEPSLLM